MASPPTIVLIGDHHPAVESHQRALAALGEAQHRVGAERLRVAWLGSTHLAQAGSVVDAAAGVWVLPGSPYDENEAIFAVVERLLARRTPLLATCAGFQYALVALARAAGVVDATHAELGAPGSPVIDRLPEPLIGRYPVDLSGWCADAFGQRSIEAEFRCSFGPHAANPVLPAVLDGAGLAVEATNPAGAIAAVHRPADRGWFLGTLFQPELSGGPAPLIDAFVRAATSSPRSS